MKKKIIFSILIIFLIGLVSAESICCEKTKTGNNWCIDVDDSSLCSANHEMFPKPCSEVPECTTLGCCYSEESGICSSNTLQKQCEEGNGDWKPTCEEIPRCAEGCCMLGSDTQYTTSTRCDELSKYHSMEYNFRQDISEEECTSPVKEEGACVISYSGDEENAGDNGCGCKRLSGEECSEIGGEFLKGYLCSNPELEENYSVMCGKQVKTGCDTENILSDPHVYWFDSGGNKENIYEGDSNQQKKSSWNNGKIKPIGEVGCNAGGSSCGLCQYDKGISICKFSEETQKAKCDSIGCEFDFNKDKTNESMNHGNSKCLYEGYVGNARAQVGSEQFVVSCDLGEIKIERCFGSLPRDMICSEIEYEDGKTEAVCRVNHGFECGLIHTEEECNANKDCMVLTKKPSVAKGDTGMQTTVCNWTDDNGQTTQSDCPQGCVKNQNGTCVMTNYGYGNSAAKGDHSVNVWSGFWFDACVSKYPVGFSLDPADSNYNPEEGDVKRDERTPYGQICGIGEAPNCFQSGSCGKTETANQMNEWCMSHGDCGANYNIVQEYSKDSYYANRELAHTDGSEPDKEYIKNLFEEELESENLPSWIGEDQTGSPGYLANWDWETNKKALETYINGNLEKGGPELDTHCVPWKRIIGSDYCELCNDKYEQFGIPCTDYRCYSLGAGCTAKPRTLNNNEEDTENQIETNQGFYCTGCEAASGEQEYLELTFDRVNTPDHEYQSSPDGLNIKINKKGEEGVPETETVEFTVLTEDPGYCEYSTTDSQIIFGKEGNTQVETMINTEHKILIEQIPLVEDSDLLNNGEYKVYIVCKDACGIESKKMTVSFKVDPTPDTNPPEIIETEPAGEESYVIYKATSTPFKVISDEKLKECRYNIEKDSLYKDMPNVFSSCSKKDNYCETDIPVDPNSADPVTIYVKCKDLYDNIQDSTSLKHVFKPSLGVLSIESFSPENGSVIKKPMDNESMLTISLTTAGGFDGSGVSNCSWQLKGFSETKFLDNPSTSHTVSISYIVGKNQLGFRCRDEAGNTAENTTSFIVEKDETSPIVTRVVKEGGSVKITTNEEAVCYYANSSSGNCGFDLESGIEIDTLYVLDHVLNPVSGIDTYYIKCKDLYQNENPGCAVIVRPTF